MRARLQVLAFGLLLVEGHSFAATKDRCIDADTQSQWMRRAGRFADTRTALLVCVDASCPSVVRDDCEQRLDELNRAQPTIVFDVKDGAGNDLIDVKISMDGKVIADKLDGKAIEVDPGAHEFVFQLEGQPPVKKTMLIKEGIKDRTEQVVLAPAPAPRSPEPSPPPVPSSAPAPVPSPAPPAAETHPPAPASSPPQTSSPSPGPLPWHTMGWVAGGTGLAGLVVGAVFGLVAISKKNDAGCDGSGACSNFGAVSDAKSAAVVSTAGWVAGGVLVGGGAALLLLTGNSNPDGQNGGKSAVRALPLLGAGVGGIALEGTW